MMASARNITRLLELQSSTIEKIENIKGTGPGGLPNGERWISLHDVFHYLYKNTQRLPEKRIWKPVSCFEKRKDAKNLWDHQKNAVNSCYTKDGFVSGNIEMDCGTGKTLVGCELIRLSGKPCMVITPHVISSKQWVDELKSYTNINVKTKDEISKSWKNDNSPFPDVIVCTYSSITRAFKGISDKECNEDTILWLYIIKNFGLLLLDEVHLAPADQFRLSCLLNYSTIIGFSGSLIREDQKISHLNNIVGPVLYTHTHGKKVTYILTTVPKSNIYENINVKSRSKHDYTLRTLNPNKMAALREFLNMDEYKNSRMVVFCDSAIAVKYIEILFDTISLRKCCGVLNGLTSEIHRQNILKNFSEMDGSALITTSVCNIAVNLPSDCIVIQVHNSNGSRCQEMQRCGRSGRGEALEMTIIHIVNECTEEEKFYKHRSDHMKLHYGDNFNNYEHKWSGNVLETDSNPIKTYIKDIENTKPVHQDRYSKLRKVLK